jgi:hypothetical protein
MTIPALAPGAWRLATDICESQNWLYLRAAKWTWIEGCAHLAPFASGLLPAAGCLSVVPADDNEWLVAIHDHLTGMAGGARLRVVVGETIVTCATINKQHVVTANDERFPTANENPVTAGAPESFPEGRRVLACRESSSKWYSMGHGSRVKQEMKLNECSRHVM